MWLIKRRIIYERLLNKRYLKAGKRTIYTSFEENNTLSATRYD